MIQNIKTAWNSFFEAILRSPAYLSLVIAISFITLIFSIWIPNLGLLGEVITSSDFSLFGKINFLWNSLGAFTTNFTPGTAIITMIVSLLFGSNVAVTVYYFKKRIALQKTSGVSVAGMLAGLIGIGCASCGSVILATFLGVGSATVVTGLLPFGGQEFAILGILLLLGAIYITAKKIADPLV